VLQAFKIGVHRGRDRKGGHRFRRPRPRGKFTHPALRLKKIQDGDPVGRRVVVRARDRLDGIISVAKVAAQNPSSTVQSLAITKVQPGIDRTPIGLAGMLEFGPRGGTIQTLFPNRPWHGEKPICPIKANIASCSWVRKGDVVTSAHKQYQLVRKAP
jgi:hypothetical protein